MSLWSQKEVDDINDGTEVYNTWVEDECWQLLADCERSGMDQSDRT
jgi:hypothetical protein